MARELELPRGPSAVATGDSEPAEGAQGTRQPLQQGLLPLRLARLHRVGAAVHAVALSRDAMYALAGTETDLRLLDRWGNEKFRYERYGEAFSAVALAPGLAGGLALQRTGRLYRLDFKPDGAPAREELSVVARGIWDEPDDIYSLDYAPDAGDRDGGLIALGHHARGLVALDGHGRLRWRLGPHEGAVARFRTWHAAISADGRTIYGAPLGAVEPGGSDAPGHLIVAIDARIGKSVRARAVRSPVTSLASLPAPLGVAAVHRGGGSHLPARGPAGCYLTAYDGELREAWSLRCPPGVMITAMASAPAVAALILGTNTGELWRVGAFTGRILAVYDTLFSSTVLCVAAADSGEVVAGLANGQVAFLQRAGDER